MGLTSKLNKLSAYILRVLNVLYSEPTGKQRYSVENPKVPYTLKSVTLIYRLWNFYRHSIHSIQTRNSKSMYLRLSISLESLVIKRYSCLHGTSEILNESFIQNIEGIINTQIKFTFA